jgi:amino acid permease
MVTRAYLGAASLYGLTILATYGLFQHRGQSFALNTLSPLDPLAIGAFVAFGASVLASYPLVFLNVRNWLRQQLLLQHNRHLARRGAGDAAAPAPAWLSVRTVAALLLSVIGLVATFVTDIGQLGSVAGAVFGSSMMFVFPPLMYMGALQQPRLVAGEGWTPAEIQRRLRWNRALLGGGLVLGAMGTFNSVKALFAK